MKSVGDRPFKLIVVEVFSGSPDLQREQLMFLLRLRMGIADELASQPFADLHRFRQGLRSDRDDFAGCARDHIRDLFGPVLSASHDARPNDQSRECA